MQWIATEPARPDDPRVPCATFHAAPEHAGSAMCRAFSGSGDGRRHRRLVRRRPPCSAVRSACPFRTPPSFQRRKDQIGASLARFVRDHFLNRDALSHAWRRVDFAAGAGRWLAPAENARKLSGDAAGFCAWLLSAADNHALAQLC
mgnify:CR=1 FL=1